MHEMLNAKEEHVFIVGEVVCETHNGLEDGWVDAYFLLQFIGDRILDEFFLETVMDESNLAALRLARLVVHVHDLWCHDQLLCLYRTAEVKWHQHRQQINQLPIVVPLLQLFHWK